MNDDREKLKNLIKQAIDENHELSVEFGGYPPIYNSKIMLEEIIRLLEQEGQEPKWRRIFHVIRENPYLNVGLLAAKSLDHDERYRFSSYAKKLHLIWNQISPLQNKIFTAKEWRAYQFYKNHKFEDYEIPGHFSGIDFSRSVLRVSLNKNDRVFQWNIKTSAQGNYYAAEIYSFPSCLGINSLKGNDQGVAEKREQFVYSVEKNDIVVLFSYAASVWDTWSVKWQPVLTSGGCVQYFNRNEKDFFKKIFQTP